MDEENKDDNERADPEYLRYKREMFKVFHEIENMEQRMIDMQVAFEDHARGYASGLHNLHEKFQEIENRQKVIEKLLSEYTKNQ